MSCLLCLSLPFLVAFFVSIIGTKLFIIYCEKNNYLGIDMHKPDKRKVALSGGVPVLFAIISGIMLYLYLNFDITLVTNLSFSLISLSIITYVGLLDDFSKPKGGLSKWQKPLLSVLALIPILIIPSTKNFISLPFFLPNIIIYSPIIYSIFISFVFIGTSNMVNMLAGFNGLEAGLGLIYVVFLGSYAWYFGNMYVTVLSFVILGALIGFYYFNAFPSKIFPGDSLTYLLGAYIGLVATVGGMEKQAFFVSIPFFIELLLKLRGKLQEQSFCMVKNNKIFHDGKIYSLPHIFAKFKIFSERGVVCNLYLIEIICCSLIWVI